MDDVAEQQELASEIADAIANPVGFSKDVDEVSLTSPPTPFAKLWKGREEKKDTLCIYAQICFFIAQKKRIISLLFNCFK